MKEKKSIYHSIFSSFPFSCVCVSYIQLTGKKVMNIFGIVILVLFVFFLEEFFSKFYRIIPTVISSLNSIDKNYLLFFQESLAAKYQILIILCENGRRSFFCTNFRKWKSFLLNHHYCR